MLEDFTTTEIINWYANQVSESFGMSRVLAKKYVLNALSYNVVSAEVFNQVAYLMNKESIRKEQENV